MSLLTSLFRSRAIASKSPTDGPWPLHTPLVRFGSDVWTIGDSFTDTLIVGEKGSGKTTGSGSKIALKFLQAGYGGLVLCFKTEEAGLWRSLLQKAGRGQDGRFFGVGEAHRFNFLDYEAAISGADCVDNLTGLLVDIGSIKRSKATGSEAHYWLPQKKKFLRNALTLLILAGQPIHLCSIYDILSSAPASLDEAQRQEWRSTSYLYDLLKEAARTSPTDPELDILRHYWLTEWAKLNPKTRGTIESDLTGLLDPLSRGAIGELFSGKTSLSPEDIFAGKLVVVDIPVARYREIGQFANLIWAQLYQRAVDRHEYTPPTTRPVFLWEDECQYFLIDDDARFQTTARSKGLATVRMTQTIPNFLHTFGADGKHAVDSLLGGHVLKIFHRNGCAITNEWAAKTIGKETRHRTSISAGSNSSAGLNTSISEVEEDACPAKEFLNLKTGGKEHGYVIEGIVFQSGRVWAGNQRWLLAEFQQDI